MMIAPLDTVIRNEHLAGRLFEERMLVITAKDSMLHHLNEVGTFIWQFIDKKKQMAEIVDAVAAHFEGFSVEENSAEIVTYLESLEKKGCILITRATGR